MAPTEGAALRLLAAEDIEGALALSAEAGWNQNADDWRLMLRHGRGLGVEAPDGGLVATAMLIPYGGRFAWIAMVLVTRAWRRRGLATDLLRGCIDLAGEQNLIAGLDATPAGREVYRPLGFQDVYGLTRWQADRARAGAGPAQGVRPMRPGDLDAVVAYDRAIFGADRGWLLADLFRRRPDHAFVAEAGGTLQGFVLARDGRMAHHLAPLVASDAATAQALAASALAAVSGPVIVDALDGQGAFASWLEAAGFRPQRPFTRMLLGRAEPLDMARHVHAVAGPEFG